MVFKYNFDLYTLIGTLNSPRGQSVKSQWYGRRDGLLGEPIMSYATLCGGLRHLLQAWIISDLVEKSIDYDTNKNDIKL